MHIPTLFSRPRQWRALAAGALAAWLLAGCGTSPKPSPKAPTPLPSANLSQGWMGTYRGTVPCTPPSTPACTSQQLALTLLPGNTYELETTVQRRGQPYTIVSKGRFQWDSSRTVITLASKDENARLRIGPGTAERLPGIDDDIDDADAYRGYILRKR